MEESERPEEDLEAQDREMLQNMHLNFERGPGRPRRWEDLSERDKEMVRDLYRKGMQGANGGG